MNYKRKKNEIKDVVADMRLRRKQIRHVEIRIISTIGNCMNFAEISNKIKNACKKT